MLGFVLSSCGSSVRVWDVGILPSSSFVGSFDERLLSDFWSAIEVVVSFSNYNLIILVS